MNMCQSEQSQQTHEMEIRESSEKFTIDKPPTKCKADQLHIDPSQDTQELTIDPENVKLGFVRRPSLQDDCPVFLDLASHHNILMPNDIDRCGSFAIRRSSLTFGDVLGQGSCGEVRSALYNGRQVAVKTVCSKLDARSQEGKDLLKEIGMMSHAFRHKNVVEFFGIYEHDGLPWLVMELMPGGSLEQYYEAKKKSRRDGRWQPKTRRAVSWVEDILSALAYLHAQEPPVIHRDIKPANMLLTGDGRTVKIGDFGLSRMCPLSPGKAPLTPGGGRGSGGFLSDESFMSLELTGTTGTYRYMVPEIQVPGRGSVHGGGGRVLFLAGDVVHLRRGASLLQHRRTLCGMYQC